MDERDKLVKDLLSAAGLSETTETSSCSEPSMLDVLAELSTRAKQSPELSEIRRKKENHAREVFALFKSNSNELSVIGKIHELNRTFHVQVPRRTAESIAKRGEELDSLLSEGSPRAVDLLILTVRGAMKSSGREGYSFWGFSSKYCHFSYDVDALVSRKLYPPFDDESRRAVFWLQEIGAIKLPRTRFENYGMWKEVVSICEDVFPSVIGRSECGYEIGNHYRLHDIGILLRSERGANFHG